MKNIFTEIVMFVLIAVFSFNVYGKDCPEFIEAAKSGDYDTVKKLLDEGCNIEMINDIGFTPLIISIFSNDSNDEVTKLLIDKGANVNATDSDDNPVLEFAVGANKIDIFKLLISKGADVNYTSKYTSSTALASACYAGLDEIAQLLIDNGAKVDVKDMHDFTALYQAVRREHLSTVKLLIKNGADVNTKDTHGHTALMMAVTTRSPKIMVSLIAAGADVNAKDDDGDTALSIAKANGPKQLMDILIKAGAKE
jgi:ankyrin repeat protein